MCLTVCAAASTQFHPKVKLEIYRCPPLAGKYFMLATPTDFICIRLVFLCLLLLFFDLYGPCLTGYKESTSELQVFLKQTSNYFRQLEDTEHV
jgi:hypothetical protein